VEGDKEVEVSRFVGQRVYFGKKGYWVKRGRETGGWASGDLSGFFGETEGREGQTKCWESQRS
jgi:hypothetical protein